MLTGGKFGKRFIDEYPASNAKGEPREFCKRRAHPDG